jgi:hypothetical protein
MYNREKGELKYCPETGEYYYESDRQRKEQLAKIAKISAVVLSLSAIGGGIYWFTTQSKPSTPAPVIKTTPKTHPKIEDNQTNKSDISPITKKTPSEVNNSVLAPKTLPSLSENNATKDKNTTKTFQTPSNSSNDKNNSSDAVFNRGEKKVFFTSMGKSVEGATIKKNVEEINLSVDDTKAKEEIKKEQSNLKKTPEKKKEDKKSKSKEKKNKKDITYSVTVKKGDTIYKIAKRVYGSSKEYKKILKANKIKNNRSLKIGQKLIIPPK